VWWDRSDVANVYWSPSWVGVVSPRAPRAQWRASASLEASGAILAEILSDAESCACGRVRVWLGATLARPLIVPGASGARSAKEAKALATMLANDATGLQGAVRTWLGPWRAGHPALAVALQETTWSELQRALQLASSLRSQKRLAGAARSLRLVSVRPWWNRSLDEALRDSERESGAFGWSLGEPDGVVHGLVEAGRVTEAGFDSHGLHDVDGALLRRRLEVGWNAEKPARHLDFSRVLGPQEGQDGLAVDRARSEAGA
jgi:rhodanese-related sulfurtransferase